MVAVSGDLVRVVSEGDQKSAYLREAMGSGKVERRVGFIGKIGILKEVRVVANDALDEKDVVEEDGSSETSGGFDPDA